LNEPRNYRAIMLSSTFTDLKEHRQRAIEVIQKLGYFPRVMEYSGAQAEADVIDTSLQMVRDAAAYIGVVSLKYGQTPVDPVRNPEKLSVTELEFDEAMRLGRPIVLFIMGDEHPVKKADIESDPDKLKRLNEFRERAKRMRENSEVHRVYEVFESLEQFSTAAATALGNLVRYLERLLPPDKSNNSRDSLRTISNIPINIPFHFVGREDDLAAIGIALNKGDGRAAIVVLHGLRGVGKSTLAATYAVRHRDQFRATWWVKAETEATMRADLVGLGVQLGWVAADAPEEQSAEAVLDRLGTEGEGIFLVYDNAIGPNELTDFLPHGSGPQVIATSNAPNWGKLATPVEIEVWQKETGADFLMARTGRAAERDTAMALSEILGGLPLAHEQAAAYCERIGVSLAEYKKRLEATPAVLLDSTSDAVGEYHGGLTVAKTFALAIEEAAKRHPAAEARITYAALLAPEPIPIYLFSEGRQEFSELFASQIKDGGLDEAIAALRAFALLDRETIPDERDSSILTESIRLHRLVRQVAAERCKVEMLEAARARLIEALAAVYPADVYQNPTAWLRARRLDVFAMALVGRDEDIPEGSERAAATLLSKLDSYRDGALATYAEAQLLSERALAIREKLLGPDHPDTALSLNNLGVLLQVQGDFPGARRCYESALAIHEKALGPDHPETANNLSNLGGLLKVQGDLAGAQSYLERALAIREKTLGPDDPNTARSLSNLGSLLQVQGDLTRARTYYERSLAIREKVLGPEHPETAESLNNLGYLLRAQHDLAGARPYYERALTIREKALGPDHPHTATSLNNLGVLLQAQGDPAGARPLLERALAIDEDIYGSDHPEVAADLNNLGGLLQEQGDFVGARPYYDRALAIFEKALGAAHPSTKTVAHNTAGLLEELKYGKEAKALRKKFGV
jgi:tetratricopeptide (TPR) repeat protein